MHRVFGCLVVLAALVGFTRPAAAVPVHHHPSASLRILENSIPAGQRPAIGYRVAHPGHKAKIYLQRDFGTSHAFKNVKRLKSPSGTVHAPAVQMGKYDYRIQVVRHKKVLTNSAGKYVYSYGSVSALQLCQAQNHTFFMDACGQGTIQVGSAAFTYAVEDERANVSPGGNFEVVAGQSSCRSAFVTYALSDADSGATTVGAQLTQPGANPSIDPQSSTSSAHSIGTLIASIRSSPWGLEFYSAGGYHVYWNATFSCWSPTGDS